MASLADLADPLERTFKDRDVTVGASHRHRLRGALPITQHGGSDDATSLHRTPGLDVIGQVRAVFAGTGERWRFRLQQSASPRVSAYNGQAATWFKSVTSPAVAWELLTPATIRTRAGRFVCPSRHDAFVPTIGEGDSRSSEAS
jgi:hypothetical protein